MSYEEYLKSENIFLKALRKNGGDMDYTPKTKPIYEALYNCLSSYNYEVKSYILYAGGF